MLPYLSKIAALLVAYRLDGRGYNSIGRLIYCDVDFHGEDVANYVSAFSVLLSILLSIFAIQYTYHSNAQVERQFNDINRAAHNIIETSKELKATESLLKDAIDKIHAHLKNNDIKIDKLTTNVNNLQGQLRGNDLNWNKKPEIATESRESANNSSPDTTASGSTAATDADADGSDK